MRFLFGSLAFGFTHSFVIHISSFHLYVVINLQFSCCTQPRIYMHVQLMSSTESLGSEGCVLLANGVHTDGFP
jgi:hypothetical protein